LALRLAVVFPGQGTASGEVSSELWGLVRCMVGDGKVPYQLSVFASSVDTFHKMRGRGVEPAVVAGHSLGEYAAAYASGSLGLAEGARLVAERDRLMTEASRETPGGMTVIIGPGPREVLEAVETEDGTVVAANFNTPRQTVISGEEGALADVAKRVSGKKYKLDVAGAFHSPFMQGAAVGMDRLLAEVSLEDPKVPSKRDGRCDTYQGRRRAPRTQAPDALACAMGRGRGTLRGFGSRGDRGGGRGHARKDA